MSQYVKPEIIVLEPAGQQKRYMLKPHGDIEVIKKKWRSHLKSIGARWIDKGNHWTIAKENLKDFEKLKQILEKGETFNKAMLESPQSKKSRNSSDDDDDSSSSDNDDDEEDSDVELIEYLKKRIKANKENKSESKIENDSSLVDDSDHEDVVSICRRLRYIYKMVNTMRGQLKDLQDENAFLYREIEKLSHKK
jgi:hypothetical protein